MRVTSRVAERLKTSDIRKLFKKSQFRVEAVPNGQFSFQKLTLAMAVRKYAKVDIKLFLPGSLLLDVSILFQIFCPGL